MCDRGKSSWLHPSSLSLLDRRAIVAALGDGRQNVVQVGDVSQYCIDVIVDADEMPPLGCLPVGHVPQSWPKLLIHIPLGISHSVLQLLQLTLVHCAALVCTQEEELGDL